MTSNSASMKASNIKWLALLVLFDATAGLLLIAPDVVNLSAIALIRAMLIPLLPLIVLILAGLISHETKARLIYWKIANPLPGSEAFTRYAPADARIDLSSLVKNVGALPSDPAEQNAKWYKLYDRVRSNAAVQEAHRSYLLFRDMAAISLILSPAAPLAMWFSGIDLRICMIALAFLLTQYAVCAVNARHAGRRFVCNVLAIHSARKVTASRAST